MSSGGSSSLAAYVENKFDIRLPPRRAVSQKSWYPHKHICSLRTILYRVLFMVMVNYTVRYLSFQADPVSRKYEMRLENVVLLAKAAMGMQQGMQGEIALDKATTYPRVMGSN